MDKAQTSKRDAILAAAYTKFSDYGFRRTSMDDIATELGISRASLYSYFTNKEEIFRTLCEELHAQTLKDAAEHLIARSARGDVQASLESRLIAALSARIGPFQKVITESSHGAEIYDEKNRLCQDVVLDYRLKFRGMLAKAIKSADQTGEIDLKAAGLSANGIAELLHLGATGLKQGATDLQTFEKRLHDYVHVFFLGLQKTKPAAATAKKRAKSASLTSGSKRKQTHV